MIEKLSEKPKLPKAEKRLRRLCPAYKAAVERSEKIFRENPVYEISPAQMLSASVAELNTMIEKFNRREAEENLEFAALFNFLKEKKLI